jgi:hypothetical protein
MLTFVVAASERSVHADPSQRARTPRCPHAHHFQLIHFNRYSVYLLSWYKSTALYFIYIHYIFVYIYIYIYAYIYICIYIYILLVRPTLRFDHYVPLHQYSFNLLYWYKSTITDTALLVQKYNY